MYLVMSTSKVNHPKPAIWNDFHVSVQEGLGGISQDSPSGPFLEIILDIHQISAQVSLGKPHLMSAAGCFSSKSPWLPALHNALWFSVILPYIVSVHSFPQGVRPSGAVDCILELFIPLTLGTTTALSTFAEMSRFLLKASFIC